MPQWSSRRRFSMSKKPETLSQLRDALLFQAENQAAHARVQPISANYEVIAARRCVAEGDVDPLSVVLDGRDMNAEAVIDILTDGFVQDAGQVAPEDFQLAADDFGG
jgi:hypothetical protein